VCFEGGGLGMQDEREGGGRLPLLQVVFVFSLSFSLSTGVARCG